MSSRRSFIIFHGAHEPCNKETDEAARLCYRQRVTEQVHRLVLFAMRLQSDRLQHHHLEPFIQSGLIGILMDVDPVVYSFGRFHHLRRSLQLSMGSVLSADPSLATGLWLSTCPK